MAVRRPIVFDTPDFVEQLQVPQDAGTPTGNMTAGGGLAAAFDGDVENYNAGAQRNATSGNIGKDFGSGVTKTITGVIVKMLGNASVDGGAGTETMTLTVERSDNGTDFTTIFTESSISVAAGAVITRRDGFTNTAAARFARISISHSGGAETHVSELEFYEEVVSPRTDSSGFFRELTDAELLEWQTAMIDHYAANPTSTLSVVSNSGTISPTMTDTRLQAGAAKTGSDGFVASFPNSSQTDDVTTVTVNFDKVSGAFDTSNTGTADTGYNYPLFFSGEGNSGSIQPMNLQDLVDSLIEPTIDLMVAATESDTTAGTFTIDTNSSKTGYTEVSGSGTAIFVDTRADTSAFTASGIPETLDQSTNVNSYYLHRRNAGSTVPSTKLLFLDNEYADPTNTKDFDIRQYSIAEATTLLGTWLQVYAAEVAGYKITYSITTDGSGGNARGSSMVDTKLNSSVFSTTLQNVNDYRAQEFPAGSPATINTYTLRVTKA